MSWKKAATVAVSAIGAYSADKASDKAAKSAKDAANRIQKAGARARTDVQEIYPEASRELFRGSSNAYDIFNQAMGQQQQALGQGNLQAQGTVSSSLPQIQAALMGLPTDFSGLQPQSVQPQQGFANPFSASGNYSSALANAGSGGGAGGNNVTIGNQYPDLGADERTVAQRTFNPLTQQEPSYLSPNQLAALGSMTGREASSHPLSIAMGDKSRLAAIQGAPIYRDLLPNLSGFSNF